MEDCERLDLGSARNRGLQAREIEDSEQERWRTPNPSILSLGVQEMEDSKVLQAREIENSEHERWRTSNPSISSLGVQEMEDFERLRERWRNECHGFKRDEPERGGEMNEREAAI
ncbi:hypothetical protein NL676_002042 [Syzygium grande]|nr:hypothetical protein NL676_002042 [Syzygium grande]